MVEISVDRLLERVHNNGHCHRHRAGHLKRALEALNKEYGGDYPFTTVSRSLLEGLAANRSLNVEMFADALSDLLRISKAKKASELEILAKLIGEMFEDKIDYLTAVKGIKNVPNKRQVVAGLISALDQINQS